MSTPVVMNKSYDTKKGCRVAIEFWDGGIIMLPMTMGRCPSCGIADCTFILGLTK